jgi:hypothetical protein
MTRLSLTLLTLLASSEAFSSIGHLKTAQPSLAFNTLSLKTASTAAALYSSSSDNNEEGKAKEEEKPVVKATEGGEEKVEEEAEPTPISDALQRQSSAFTVEPEQQERLDPLIASLTRMDADMVNTPTTKVPLLGEIPLDGSIVVLLPVALIAVVGFIMSINIAFNSADIISQKVDQVSNVLSTPPAKKTVQYDGCRGLCSDQDGQLDNMRIFMNSLAKKTPEVENVVVPEVAKVEIKEEAPAATAAPEAVKEEIKEEAPATPEVTSTSETEAPVSI